MILEAFDSLYFTCPLSSDMSTNPKWVLPMQMMGGPVWTLKHRPPLIHS